MNNTKYDSLISRLKAEQNPISSVAANAIAELVKCGLNMLIIFKKFGETCDNLVNEISTNWDNMK